MSHLPALVIDLALILISAGIITLIFKWLKQPLVLGYIVAGFLAGPYVDIFPTVVDTNSISTWAEIGVIFLLFALGLEFSFKKLMNVGGTAVIAATTEVITMLVIGYVVGILLGWNPMNSIFLGGMLSMSSTTIIIKAFDDLGLRNQKFTRIVFGTLVVEDLVAILMMVLLSTMAVSQQFAGEELIGSIIKVVFFLILWFLIGIYLLPAFFRKARKMMNDETLLVIVVGLCLGMVYLATITGFSAALGAFIMGSILAETVEAEHIEHLIKPVKDLFGAIFFVSVGMLVDPAVLVEYALPVVIITLVTIAGKALFSTFGVLISGQPIKTSIQSGFSLAQIGEFAFIIASLGVSLKVLDEYVYPIIVAVSVITTFTTPYFIRLSEPFSNWIHKILPENTLAFFERYASGTKTINHESDWKKLLKSFMGKLVIYSVLLSAILLLSIHFLAPFIMEQIPDIWGKIASAALTILLMAPFLTALIANKTNQPELFMSLWNDSKYNRGRLVFLVLLRVYIALTFVALVLINLFHVQYGIGIITAVAVLALVFFFRRNFNQYSRMESQFITNLNQREEVAKKAASSIKTSFTSQMHNKNIHITEIEVSPNSPNVGKTLRELKFRHDFGVSVVKILRGERKIYIPDSSEVLYPQDIISVVGTDEQIERFSVTVENYKNNTIQEENREMSLQSFTIDDNFPFIGQSISKSQIGMKFNCMIIGVERESGSFMNPDPSIVFEQNDLVWVVGEKEILKRICS